MPSLSSPVDAYRLRHFSPDIMKQLTILTVMKSSSRILAVGVISITYSSQQRLVATMHASNTRSASNNWQQNWKGKREGWKLEGNYHIILAHCFTLQMHLVYMVPKCIERGILYFLFFDLMVGELARASDFSNDFGTVGHAVTISQLETVFGWSPKCMQRKKKQQQQQQEKDKNEDQAHPISYNL